MVPIPELNSKVKVDHQGRVMVAPGDLIKWGRLAVQPEDHPDVMELPGADGLRAFYAASLEHGMNLRNPWAPTQPMDI